MNKFFKLFSGLLCLPLIGGIMMNSTAKDVVRADAATLTKEWDLTTQSTDFTNSGCVTYFNQPYGIKKVNAYIAANNIANFTDNALTSLKIGVKCLQNGSTKSKLTISLIDSNSSVVGTGVVVTPTNSSSATKTTYQYATFSNNLDNVTGFQIKCTTFEKNILINGASYEATVADSAQYLKFNDAVKAIASSGSKHDFSASVSDGSSATITYSSSDDSVLSIDKNTGSATAKKAGIATITASCDGMEDISIEVKVISNNTGLSSDSPFSGTEAKEIVELKVYDTNTDYYVEGYVSKLDMKNSVLKGFFIDGDIFKFYNISAGTGVVISKIAVGSYVVGYGRLTVYNSICELNECTIVSVWNKEVASIEITGDLTTKTTYKSSSKSWNASGLVVNAVYNDGDKSDVTSNVSWTFSPATPYDVDLEGLNSKVCDIVFTASYQELTASNTYQITVNKEVPVSLSVNNQKTIFSVGDYFDLGDTGKLTLNHNSSIQLEMTLDDVEVYLDNVLIDVNSYVLSSSDNDKTVNMKYTTGDTTVSLKKTYKITVENVVVFEFAIKDALSNYTENTKIDSFQAGHILTLSASYEFTTDSQKPFYSVSSSEWRLYQDSQGTKTTNLTLSLPAYGYEFFSIEFTYNGNNNGVLLDSSGNKVDKFQEYVCTGKEVNFSVGKTTEDTKNGQVKITSVKVKLAYDTVGTWCSTFLGDLVCDSTGRIAPSKDDWSILGEFYIDDLTIDMQSFVRNFDVVASENIVDRALTKYDYIIAKYNTEASGPYIDFIERISAGKITLKSNNLFMPMEITSSSFAIITFITLASVTAIGGYLVIKRRKEN